MIDVPPHGTSSEEGASQEAPAKQKKEKKKKLKPTAGPDNGAAEAAALAPAADAVQAEEHVNGGLNNSAEGR